LIESEATARQAQIQKEQEAADKARAIQEKVTAERIKEIERRNKLESEQLLKLQEFAQLIEDQQIEAQQARSDRDIEEFQQQVANRERDYQLFLESNILEAQTQDEFYAASIIKLQEQNRLAEENIKLSEEQKRNIIAKNQAAIVQIERQANVARIQQLNALSAAFMNASKLLGESTEAGKVLAVASTIISTYQAAQQAFASLAGIPVVGPGLGAAAAAVAVASGLARVRSIQQVQVPGFADGGVVEGFVEGGTVKSSIYPEQFQNVLNNPLTGQKVTDSTGIPIVRTNGDNRLVTVKTGEVILNKEQQDKIKVIASSGFNKVFDPFKAIGVPGYAQGGFVSSGMSNAVNTGLLDAINAKPIYVSVQEINDVNARIKAIEQATIV
jgi:hypothetical protein